MTVANLNIAMVIRSFSVSGGLELYTHKLVEGLVAKGHKVTVICEENSSTFKHEKLTVELFKPPPKRARKSNRIKFYYHLIPEIIKDLGPFDLVHSQHLAFPGADVVTYHNHTVAQFCQSGWSWEKWLNRTKAKSQAYKLRDQYDLELFKQARCLIFTSKTCRNDFIQVYGGTGPIPPTIVSYPGSDLSVPPQNTTHQSSPTPTFLFVGKGFRKKGLDILLQACLMLKLRGKEIRLLIAGLNAKPLNQLALQLMGLGNTVKYLGFCKDMDIVYSQASVFIMPSRLEPFGMAALQAMRFGLAPIVSRVSGASELIINEQTGLILENHLSASELANLMQRLIDAPSFTNQLGEAARVVALSTTWDNTVESTLKAYEIALNIELNINKHKEGDEQ